MLKKASKQARKHVCRRVIREAREQTDLMIVSKIDRLAWQR